jgi:hypothetical protein
MDDSFTMGIAHRDRDGCEVLDLLFERKPPLSPYAVAEEIAAVLKQYHCNRLTGDNYAARWVRDAFVKIGVAYHRSTLDRSQIYLNVLPLFASGRVRLLDCPRLVAQFAALERRTFSTGRESVNKGRGAKDDAANSAAGALLLASQTARHRVPISQPTLFSTRDGSVIIGPQSIPSANATPLQRATSPCQPPAPIGGFRPSASECWYPFINGGGRPRARWPGS